MAHRGPGAAPTPPGDDATAPRPPVVPGLDEDAAGTLLAVVELLSGWTRRRPSRAGEIVAEIAHSLRAGTEQRDGMMRPDDVEVVLHGPDGAIRSLPPQPSVRQVYGDGLAAIEQLAVERFATSFCLLDEPAQLEVLRDRSETLASAVQRLIDAVRLHMAQSSGSPLAASAAARHQLVASLSDTEAS